MKMSDRDGKQDAHDVAQHAPGDRRGYVLVVPESKAHDQDQNKADQDRDARKDSKRRFTEVASIRIEVSPVGGMWIHQEEQHGQDPPEHR